MTDTSVQKDTATEYPETIWPDDVSSGKWDYISVLLEDDAMSKAINKAQEIGGQIYTQVDTDGNAKDTMAYSRGLRYVNRTGVYLVCMSERHVVTEPVPGQADRHA